MNEFKYFGKTTFNNLFLNLKQICLFWLDTSTKESRKGPVHLCPAKILSKNILIS